jgi:hypothetical protein
MSCHTRKVVRRSPQQMSNFFAPATTLRSMIELSKTSPNGALNPNASPMVLADATERMAYKLLPRRELFKFRSLAEEKHLEWVRQIVEDSQLYFPTPFELNDPWDCKARVQVPNPDNPVEFDKDVRYLLRAARKHSPGASEAAFAATEEKLRTDSAFLVRLFNEATPLMHNTVNTEFRICSFASDRKHPLLWSHYADAHRGICLVFSAERAEFGCAERVEYQYTQPSVPLSALSGGGPELAIATFLTKARYWSYEYEYRIVKQLIPQEGLYASRLSADGKWTFQKQDLIGVIYGCQIGDDKRTRIEAMLAKRRSPVSRVRAVRGEDRYALRFEALA